MPTILVPTPLRRLTGRQSKVNVPGATVAEVVEQLESAYPGFAERLVGEDGQIKRLINVFVAARRRRQVRQPGAF